MSPRLFFFTSFGGGVGKIFETQFYLSFAVEDFQETSSGFSCTSLGSWTANKRTILSNLVSCLGPGQSDWTGFRSRLQVFHWKMWTGTRLGVAHTALYHLTLGGKSHSFGGSEAKTFFLWGEDQGEVQIGYCEPWDVWISWDVFHVFFKVGRLGFLKTHIYISCVHIHT